ncbi:MAG: hypothetical protein M3Y82_11560 [Verrucomicrobiota bacterium]|nr:hypothetical protein [Verrucomicrobiota bacterium]
MANSRSSVMSSGLCIHLLMPTEMKSGQTIFTLDEVELSRCDNFVRRSATNAT